jgi:4-hydroxybenzoate polyprenyltransferase
VVANASGAVLRKARAVANVTDVFDRPAGRLAALLKALRPHQWLKNLLVFVPLLTAHRLTDATSLLQALAAFVAFSLCASATYIANDLFDLRPDRAHARKRMRPFAAGDLPIAHGVAVAACLLVVAFALAAATSWQVCALLVTYVGATTAYSLAWKAYFLIDVLTLAGLYTLRILVGAAAIGVGVSFWLLAFSVFLFFSLALVKRVAELATLQTASESSTRGRDYRTGDAHVLEAMGIASGYSAVLVFALYINSPDVVAQYGTPQLLWLACGGLLYWISRMWIKTARGEMHDDPLAYAIRDRGGGIVIALMLIVSLLAYVVRL